MQIASFSALLLKRNCQERAEVYDIFNVDFKYLL